ncbi:hypothetical protein ACFVU4_35705, partial [Streptomyces sp. NPDC058107]|uniref:hypothetical protein n=1 Tax=Streptomyces sp. NPDC058107 TaxID=3346343 RepID=UPI0036ED9BA0
MGLAPFGTSLPYIYKYPNSYIWINMFDVISEQGCRVVSSMYPVLTVNKSVQVEINNRVPSYTGTWNFSSAGTASWGSDIPLSQPMLPPIYSATSPVAFTRGYPINGNHGWSIYG